ncbi:hypothetical protein VNO77_04991 [Canavalia gladiata]|uniref:Uncharacterized protein n=1 Tax=Canavalia gladiata TaxID=3824 RepID=A0AAN9MY81_CANGL
MEDSLMTKVTNGCYFPNSKHMETKLISMLFHLEKQFSRDALNWRTVDGEARIRIYGFNAFRQSATDSLTYSDEMQLLEWKSDNPAELCRI